jgi:hypothetical protein
VHIEHTNSFTAFDDRGAGHLVHEFTEMHDVAGETLEGLKFYTLSIEGHRIMKISDNEFTCPIHGRLIRGKT